MAVSVPIIILLCLFAYRAPSLAGAGITRLVAEQKQTLRLA